MGDIPASALKSIESNSPQVSMSGGEGMMMGTQRIAVSDHMISGLTGKSDSIIVDLENFSSHGGGGGGGDGIGGGGTGGADKDVNSISRIKLQRSLSRKVPNRGGGGDRDSLPAFSSSSASPRAAQTMASSTPEKPASSAPHMVISLGPTEHNINGHQQQHHLNLQHQIAIIKTGAGHVSTTINDAPESRWGRRSNSIKRSPPSRLFDPKRVLFFFATLSSLGTLLLIFFTLSMSKTDDSEGGLDWQR